MLYDKKYPHMKRLEERDGLMRGTTKDACCMCGRLTEFVETSYRAPFCSEECLAKFENKETEPSEEA